MDDKKIIAFGEYSAVHFENDGKWHVWKTQKPEKPGPQLLGADEVTFTTTEALYAYWNEFVWKEQN